MNRLAGWKALAGVSILAGSLLLASEPLVNAGHLESFFGRLSALENRQIQKLRILHFGDSHIVSEHEASTVRYQLQTNFGDGGPGLWLPWTPPRYYLRRGIQSGCSAGWYRFLPRKDSFNEDAGLSGCFMEASGPGHYAWMSSHFSELEITYLRQPGGGGARVFLDGQEIAQLDASGPTTEPVQFSYKAPGGDRPRKLEIWTRSAGDFRILGVNLERSGPGIAYSSLGLLGARADQPLKIREECFRRQLNLLKPDLILLSYGTNEAGDPKFDPATYAQQLSTLIGRIRTASPSTALMMLAPPDRSDAKRVPQGITQLLKVIETQRQVCRNLQVPYFETLQAMGGPGISKTWAAARPPLAQPDGVHYTPLGYERLSQLLCTAFFQSFDDCRRRLGQPVLARGSAAVTRKSEGIPFREPPAQTIVSYHDERGRLVLTSEAKGSSAVSTPLPRSPQKVYYVRKENGQLLITQDPAQAKGKLMSENDFHRALRAQASE